MNPKLRQSQEVSSIARGPADEPREATFEYSSYDDQTPMLDGGLQYRLQPGDRVVVFAGSFESTEPPAYLLHGRRDEVLHRVEALRDDLRQMTADRLASNEIDEN